MNIGTLNCFFILVILNGCSKNYEEHSPQPIKKVLYGINSRSNKSESKTTLNYDIEGRLIGNATMVVFPHNTSKSVLSIKYNHHNMISEIISNELYNIKFYFKNTGVLERTEEYDHKGRLAVTHTYHYDTKGFLNQIIDQLHLEENQGTFIKNSYHYDQNKNLAAVKIDIMHPHSENFEPWHETRYEDYDHKINPFPVSMSHPYIALNNIQMHNVGKITSIEAKTGNVLSVLKREYVYDKDGYPISSVQRVFFGSDQVVTTSVYNYNSELL